MSAVPSRRLHRGPAHPESTRQRQTRRRGRAPVAAATEARSLRRRGPNHIVGSVFVVSDPRLQRRMTTSRYSLGTTSESGPARLRLIQQVGQIAFEAGRVRGRQDLEGLVQRAVPVAEHFNEMGSRAIAEVEIAARGDDGAGSVDEEIVHVRFNSPQGRRLQTRPAAAGGVPTF